MVMSIYERIKQAGGIADFMTVCSGPWAILNDDTLLTTPEYEEFHKLLDQKKLKFSGKANPAKWKYSEWFTEEGNFYTI
jgi:hypothetical protein